MGAGRPSEFRPEYCAIAENVLANGESKAAVCAELEISKQTLYDWQDMHPEFKEAIEIGLYKSQRDWEAIGRNAALGGVDKFPQSSWIFTMKNRFRDDYAEEKKEDKQDAAASLLENIISGKIKVKQD